MRAGDTFFFRDKSYDRYRHLWVIISDPENYPEADIVLVSLTSYKPYIADKTCMLEPGSHPFITKPSLASYCDTQALSRDQISQLMIPAAPMSADVLKKIRRGAAKTRWIPKIFKLLLKEQQVI